MNYPPDYLDEARILKWAWSGSSPFGVVGPNAEDQIFGFAICRYEDTNDVYRFSCNKDWKVIQDSPHDSIEQVIDQLPEQYKNAKAIWKDK